MGVAPAEYAAAFLAPLGLAWGLTPLMMRVATRLKVLDRPDDRKSHSEPVPYLGGVAIVIAFSVVVAASAAVYRPTSGLGDLVLVLGVGSLLALMGLVDDLRGLSAGLRLLLEAGAGVAVWGVGSGVALPGPTASDILITVFWVVGITNAFNLLDNMDGLSAGVAAIGATSFFVLAVLNGQYLVAALAAAVAGCAVGFLRHNFHPAKIYMGDAGSLFLGFLLAVLGLRLRFPDAPQTAAVFVPVLVLGVALFDTILVTIARLRHGRGVMQGGRDHTSHRLVWVGLSVPVSVGLIYGGAAALGWIAIVVSRVDLASAMLLVSFVFVVGVVLLALLFLVPVYENSRARRHMIRLVREHEIDPIEAETSGASTQTLRLDA
jgi:UDP-GlcNAc:undecaprenyl-phosphate GlcNAc-1-phosphate transferase